MNHFESIELIVLFLSFKVTQTIKIIIKKKETNTNQTAQSHLSLVV